MSMARMTQKGTERLRQILDVAESLFITKGYEQTTIQDILDGTGIGKGTFYHYFESKSQLMDAMIGRWVGSVGDAAQAIADEDGPSAGEKLRRIMLSARGGEHASSELVDELHQEGNEILHERSKVMTLLSLSPVLEQVLRQGIREGSCSTPYPRESVELLLAASQFLLDPCLFSWTDAERLARTRALARLMERTLAARAGSFEWLCDAGAARPRGDGR